MQKLPVVWITGSGSNRVGRYVADHFAKHGYRIALHAYQNREQADECAKQWNSNGIPTIVTQSAIHEESQVQTSVAQIIDAFGQVDAFVHCAAIWEDKRLEETTAEDVLSQFKVNTLGCFLCAKAVGLQMVKQPSGGSITLIGDWAVARPYVHFSSYFISKGSIETLTRTLAVELANRNASVRVNAILPGPVMLDSSISTETAEHIRQASLVKRLGTPEHVAQAAYFLATHDFITGVALPVDGGRSIWAAEGNDAIAHPSFEK